MINTPFRWQISTNKLIRALYTLSFTAYGEVVSLAHSIVIARLSFALLDVHHAKENQKKALEMSAKAVLERMNDRTIELLEKEFNSAEAWIISKIEAACKANNENKNFFELK